MTTEARSLEQCVADARAILDGATPGPWELEQYGGVWAGDDILFPAPEYGQYRDGDADLITLSRNTYSSLLDLVEAAERLRTAKDAWRVEGEYAIADIEAISAADERLFAALRAVHESLQENLPR